MEVLGLQDFVKFVTNWPTRILNSCPLHKHARFLPLHIFSITLFHSRLKSLKQIQTEVRAKREPIETFFKYFKIGCSTKVTKCGFGSNHQTSQVMHGFQVPYHRSCLPYRVGFWVGPLGYSGPISFWGSFLAIFSHFLNGPGANKT